LLALESCTVSFGGLIAVDDLSLEVQPRELVSLIGPNGAGKTTVFNAITGVYPLARGVIRLEGAALSGLPPHRVAHQGVGRTFQNIRLFRGLTVLDNLRAAMHQGGDYDLIRAAFRSRRWAATETRLEARARDLLNVFGLGARAEELAGSLPYGEQRRLEIVRALATEPRLLLLDEPAAGMNPAETQRLMELIRSLIERFSLTILLIEHDMKLVMGVSDRVVVLNYGREIARGTPEQIAHDPAVIEAYLGEPTH
jgi:branched-chain amino acid transport system ATP-binding protein